MRKFLITLLCLSLIALPVKAENGEKLVALTFDDGPSGRFTRRLLDGLEKRNIKATFLLCGYRMAQYPELTLRIHNSGHEIGLHGYSHKCMGSFCRQDAEEEIRKSMVLIPEGCDVNFLRSPGGMSSRGVKAAAKDWDLSLLYWSVDPKDWATSDADAVEQQVIRQVKDGDIILLHDMSDSSVEAALVIVDELLEEGFRFVTVSQLAKAKGKELIPGEEYYHFRDEKTA